MEKRFVFSCMEENGMDEVWRCLSCHHYVVISEDSKYLKCYHCGSFQMRATVVIAPVAIVRCSQCGDLHNIYHWCGGSCPVCGHVVSREWDNNEQFVELCDNGYALYSRQQHVDLLWALSHSVDCVRPYFNWGMYCCDHVSPVWHTMEESSMINATPISFGSAIMFDVKSGFYYYSDETWTALCGPFCTKVEAQESLSKYSYWLEYGDGYDYDNNCLDLDGSIAELDDHIPKYDPFEDAFDGDLIFEENNLDSSEMTGLAMAEAWLKDYHPVGGFTEKMVRQLMFDVKAYKALVDKYEQLLMTPF